MASNKGAGERRVAMHAWQERVDGWHKQATRERELSAIARSMHGCKHARHTVMGSSAACTSAQLDTAFSSACSALVVALISAPCTSAQSSRAALIEAPIASELGVLAAAARAVRRKDAGVPLLASTGARSHPTRQGRH